MIDTLTIKILKEKIYLCLALRLAKGSDNTSSNTKVDYAFHITKANQFCCCLLIDKKLRILYGHKIALLEEIKSSISNGV